MKKNIEVTYDGLSSFFEVEESGCTIITVIKKPNAEKLRVMVNEVEAEDVDNLFLDWDENWRQMGMRVKQELLRRDVA